MEAAIFCTGTYNNLDDKQYGHTRMVAAAAHCKLHGMFLARQSVDTHVQRMVQQETWAGIVSSMGSLWLMVRAGWRLVFGGCSFELVAGSW